MFARVARMDSGEVMEVVITDHCLLRFRARGPYREAGGDAALAAVVRVLEDDCHVMRLPPGWAVSDRGAPMWAASATLAFPLERSGEAGRWVATTCLRKER